MTYDPFSRGGFPVGVRSLELADAARNSRRLPTEIWYPAEGSCAGLDLARESRDTYTLVPGFPVSWQHALRDAAAGEGSFPLILFSHGFSGHRRQSTFFCSHLASHGYVVAAVDHTGNTITEIIAHSTSRREVAATGGRRSLFDETMEQRPGDMRFLVDQLLGEPDPGLPRVDPERVGMSGHSFGGWTSLATTAAEARIQALLLLAPAGAAPSLRKAIDFAWGREVAALFIVAELDSILPLAGMYELHQATPEPKKLVIIDNADHMHFCDGAERVHEMVRRLPAIDKLLGPHQPLPPFAELCPAAHGRLVTCGLGLAHFDSYLKEMSEAAELLAGDIEDLLAERQVAVRVE